MPERKDLQITVNIPFCLNRCTYCVHPIYCVGNTQLREQYMEALGLELDSLRDDLLGYTIRSIYITGGTPTLVNHESLAKFILRLRKELPMAEDLEISMETIPGSIGADPLASYRRAGVKRFDLGVCTTHPIEWESLERPHNYQAMYGSCQLFQFAGHHNYGMDLLYGLPGQTPNTLRDSIAECLGYYPAHFSLYPLVLSPASRMYACFVENKTDTGVTRNKRELPTEEAKFEMYKRGRTYLAEKGFSQYTLYHFARPGYTCLYRALACADTDTIGLGLGAESYTDGVLVRNTTDLETYLQGAGDFQAVTASALRLDARSRMNRYVVNALTAVSGISKAAFLTRFDTEFDHIYAASIDALANEGLLEETEAGLRLSERGAYSAQTVFKKLQEM